MARKTKIERFNEAVYSKYELYSHLLYSLPYKNSERISILLPLFRFHCKQEYAKKYSPKEIVDSFITKYGESIGIEKDTDFYFQCIQYVERQVVLFDSIEEASFSYVNNMHGRGTLRHLKEKAVSESKVSELKKHFNDFNLRVVLTAHPTQFYPNKVLRIIENLATAIGKENQTKIKELLTQLSRTRFFSKKKPTPYDEALSLIWYLKNVFYHSASSLYNYLQNNIFLEEEIQNSIFDFGFWPCGDRDGNPFVTPDITLKTARKLKSSILKCYYQDIRKLKNKLTFDVVEDKIVGLENKLYAMVYRNDNQSFITQNELYQEICFIEEEIRKNYYGLYLNEILNFKNKLKIFGFHFATLDIRQDSRVHNQVFLDILSHPKISGYLEIMPEKEYISLSLSEKYQFLTTVKGSVPTSIFEEGITKDTIGSILAMQTIQKENGELGCNRYIISNCQSLENILQLYALLRMCGWEKPTADLIPLFETVDDLKASEKIMDELYTMEVYQKHLETRKRKQVIMLGFSDGTKDGGYIKANWGIYNAKEKLSQISRNHDIKVAFFDGRGGPPARGGGNTHLFYSSLGNNIQNNDIQITIQGQTISSNFGTVESSQYNLEQLLSAGTLNKVFHNKQNNLTDEDRATLETLADLSYTAYDNFKNHPQFLSYLENMTTLKYYGKANIGSRPSKRGNTKQLSLGDLRAIPFVGSWSQSKLNVPGFFGVGKALEYYEKKNEFDKVVQLYNQSPFFKTLISNSMMSLSKTFFSLTEYIGKDPVYGEFWNIIHDEYQLSKRLILKLSGFKTLMEDEPTGKKSIQLREDIVQPLITIQQYAFQEIEKLKEAKHPDEERIEVLEALITRSLFGNINASRNSA